MNFEIEIPRTIIKQSIRIFLATLGLAGVVLLGYRNSPLGLSGRPVLLSPRLAKLTRYQHNTLRWAGELQEIQTDLKILLENPPADLLAQDNQANAALARVAALQANMDGTTVPTTLSALNSAVQTALEQTAQAAADTLTWISEPSADAHAAAWNALEAASAALARLDQDPWMERP